MHILTLTTLFPSPMRPVHAVFVRARMEAFTRRYGHAYTVVAPVPYFPKIPWKAGSLYGIHARMPRREEPWGYPIHHPRYLVTPKVGMRFYGSWMARGVRETILAIHERNPIDIIDGHYLYPDATAAVRMGQELGIPVILSARGTDLNVFARLPYIKPLIAENIRACTRLVCVSTELKKIALGLNADDAKTSVIGNGVDASRFQLRDQKSCREALGLTAEGKILLGVGRLTQGKGFHIALEALALLNRPDVRLVLAGSGDQDQALLNRAGELGIRDQVFLAGPVANKDLPNWYGAADLFVFPTEREGWPNVVCEALASGLPVVASAVSGIPELVNDGSLGILVNERATQPFAEALRQGLGKTWDLAQIAKVGGSRTWDSVAESLEKVFQEALVEGRRPARPAASRKSAS